MKKYNKEQIQNYLKEIVCIITDKNIDGVYFNISQDMVQLRVGNDIEYESYIDKDSFNIELDRSIYDINGKKGYTYIDKLMPIWELLEIVKKL